MLKELRKASRENQGSSNVLDFETAKTICTSRQMVEFDPAISKEKSYVSIVHTTSFKSMKQEAKGQRSELSQLQQEDQEMIEETPF